MKIQAFFILLCLTLFACVQDKNQSPNEVLVHLASDPDGLHPTNNNSGNRSYVFQYTQKTLVRMDLKDLVYVPDLAKRLPEVDTSGTIYTYSLREDAIWDDSTRLTVDDVIFSVKTVCAHLTNNASVKGNYTSVIKDIEKVSDYQFKLETFNRQRGNEAIFSNIYIQQEGFHDPKHILRNYNLSDLVLNSTESDSNLVNWFETYNDPAKANNPEKFNGAGPYKVTDWKKDEYILLKKKENHFTQGSTKPFELAYPDQIIFKIIPDDAAASLALKNQELDVSTWLGTQELIQLQADSVFNQNYESHFVDQFTYTYYALNMRPKPELTQVFKDSNVRKAMAYLTPVDEIMETFLSGKAIRQITNVSSRSPFFNSSLKPIPFDPAKAVAILENGGWRDRDGNGIREKEIEGKPIELSFTFTYINSDDMKEIALMIQEEMQAVGVDMKIEGVSFNQFIEKVMSRDFEAMMGAWGGSASYSNPGQLWSLSSYDNGGLNYTGFGSSKTDSLIQVCNKALNEEDFESAYHALQKEIYQTQPYVFLYSVQRKIAIHKRLQHPGVFVEKPGVMINAMKLNPEFSPGKTLEKP